MTLTVAVIAPGAMGAGIAKRLSENNASVLTSLKGRSKVSAARAREAGMQDVDERQLIEADLFLSIVPPGKALALAKHFAPLLAAANRKPVYADCNAVGPDTMTRIAAVIAETGAPFAAAGIIGPPPKPGSSNTRIYTSGMAAGEVATLGDYGLIVQVLDGPLTAASALKMSYAGITKGFTALGTAMLLAATRGGAAEALKAELEDSRPDLLGYLSRLIPTMYPKAYRFADELDEISEFVGKDHPESAMLSAAARLYERIAADFDGDKQEIAALNTFLER